MLNIMLVDDHVLFRDGLAALLNGQPDMRVVGEASSGAEAIVMHKTLRPDLILLDFGLPNGSGLDVMRAVLAEQPEAKIIFLTMHEENRLLFEAIRGGAKGYIIKHEHIARLLAYIRGVERGEPAISPDMTSKLFDEITYLPRSAHDGAGLPDLSPRETEVYWQLATGASNHEIAERLVIAENTVRKHVSNILQKLHMRTRREVADLVRHRGM